jgi:hypothetical protein
MPIDEDHSNLVKFRADDQDCQAIITFMHDIAANVTPHVTQTRGTSAPNNPSIDEFSLNNEDIKGLYIYHLIRLPAHQAL